MRTNVFGAIVLAILTLSLALPLATLPAAAEERVPATWTVKDGWTYLQNDAITIVFPAGGTKPMFLWWATQDPDNINVVKYKGLVEYVTFDEAYFLRRHLADAVTIRERIQRRFFEPRRHTIRDQLRLHAIWQTLSAIGNFSELHAPYLPFGGSEWALSPPVNVTKGDVQYLSFNFTLVDVPDYRPNLQFAENNIILRCRFYYTPATEEVYGLYTYTVNAGELKMDLVVNRWEWNIDRLAPLLNVLRDYGFAIPEGKAGLALWINLASINLTSFDAAAADATAAGDPAYTEAASGTANVYVEGQRVATVQNRTGTDDEQPLQNRWRERAKFRFAQGDGATQAGFFKFVPQAVVTDGVSYDVVDVSASYLAAGRHLRVFLGYPYFGDSTLEHDPSLGLDSLPTLMTPGGLLLLVGTVSVIALVVLVVRWQRRPVNIVGA
jgi:hypothetical protein